MWCTIFPVVFCVRADDFQGATHMMPFEEDTIGYNNATPTGAVAQLQQRIESGAATLKHARILSTRCRCR
jgi:hypothetical protein